ncbi:MAG: META domain-containing protein [Deltaproteobacteria bacterium]|nr:MAG: META domain-containing protein [Deltaproteobacteria bacterium]
MTITLRKTALIVSSCLLMVAVYVSLDAAKRDSTEIIGVDWKWQQSLYNNDTKAVPPDPANYTLKLQADGSVSVKADCNRAGGTYKLTGGGLSIEITHSTMAACPPDSLEGKFIKDLNAAAIYFIEGGNLYIDLQYHSGTMKFSK